MRNSSEGNPSDNFNDQPAYQGRENTVNPSPQPPAKNPSHSVEPEFVPVYSYDAYEAASQAMADSGRPPTDAANSATAVANPEKDAVSVFKNRNFMMLWIAQALTQTAQYTLNLALVNYVAKLSNNSSTQTSIVTACFLLPGVFFSAIAGVFVDRFKKRHMLLATNLARAVIVPWLVFMPLLPLAIALPIIFLITLIFSTISQFFAPAEAAAIPLLVSPSQLTRANSLFQVTLFGSLFIGVAVLGPLLPSIIGAENVFWVMSGLYAICVVLVWLLPKDEVIKRKEEDQNLVQTVKRVGLELWEAWKFIRVERPIWLAIIYASMVQTILFFMIALGLPYVENKGLNQPQSALVFVLAPLAIGLGIAVAMVNKMVTPRNRNRVLIWATACLGVNIVAVGLVKPLADLWVGIFTPGAPIGGPGLIALLIGLSLPFGFAIGILNISALTIMQERSPADVVGRVFAAYFTFANAVSIVPIVFGGALGDIIGIVPVFFIFGAFVGLIALYANRDLKKYPASYQSKKV